MGHEKNGQLYSLDVENHLHDQALVLRDEALEAMNATESALHYGDVTGAERTQLAAEYSRHETQVLKLTSYCIRQGLLSDDFEQAA